MRACYMSGIGPALTAHLRTHFGKDASTRSHIEHAVDIMRPLNKLSTEPQQKLQFAIAVSARVQDMASDGFAQSKCVKYIASTLGTFVDPLSVLEGIRLACPHLGPCLRAADGRVVDASI